MNNNNNNTSLSTTTTALATTTNSTAGPRVRPPRRPDIVLEEDQWTDAIEAIIERDYFPEIPKAQSKLEWMDAVQSGDPARIRQAQLNIAQRRAGLRTPMTSARPAAASDTPWLTTHATPWRLDTGVSQVAPETNATAPPPQRLDAFLQQHTSEDNASFDAIIQSDAAVRAQRRAQRTQPAFSKAGPQPSAKRLTDGFGSTGQPSMALAPPRANPLNRSLHPGDPDARPELQLSTAELASRVAGPPKQIRASNTRFSSAGGDAMPPPPERDAAATAIPTTTTAAGARPAPEPQHGTSKTVYNYLDTPSMTPSGAPLMTWGDIQGTPLRLVDDADLDDGMPDVADAQGRRFRMPEVRKREVLARRMATGGGGGAPRGAMAGVAIGRPPSAVRGMCRGRAGGWYVVLYIQLDVFAV